mgnify:CR=1 FL=1
MRLQSCYNGGRLSQNAVRCVAKKEEKMKNILFLSILLVVFTSCDTVETDPGNIQPMPVSKIEKIDIVNNSVKILVTVSIGSPCWGYYKTESSKTENTFVAKIYAQLLTTDPCITMMSSFTREETIYFSSSGEKNIKFWQNDSTYIDTTIVL